MLNIIIKIFKCIYFIRLRIRLKSGEVTILSNNCAAGVIYHRLKLKFKSPTINLSIDKEDFFEFIQHLHEYGKCSMIEDTSSKEPYPVGILGGDGLKNIRLNFMHYKSFEQAKEKWFERYKRINYNNICIVMETGIATTREIKESFQRLPFDKKVMFINELDLSFPEGFFVDIYNEDYVYGKLFFRDLENGIGQYLNIDRFDYVAFLNHGKIKSASHIRK